MLLFSKKTALAVLLAFSTLAGAQVHYTLPPIPAGFKKVEGKYHTLIYDLTDDEAKEVLQHMEAMVDEYLARTRDFSGRLSGKMPFMIFRKSEDYYANGGMAGTAGVFIPGKALMAIAGDKLTGQTWHVIQHEGFHQFASSVIGGDMPSWTNEGMAEYFGEAIYTGDGFVSGAIPEYRLRRIQADLKIGRFKSVASMMRLSHEQWNLEMNGANYDQAWSMVQFLAHGENGKYQKPFATFMLQLGRGMDAQQAWNMSFGSAEGFEKRWNEYWTALPENPTLAIFARANAQMLASFAGRAAGQKQVFKDIDELVAAIKDGSIKTNPQDVLPKSLAGDCASMTEALEKASITFALQTIPAPSPAARPPSGTVKCTMPDGTVITVTFRTHGARGAMADVKVVDPPKPKPAAKAVAK